MEKGQARAANLRIEAPEVIGVVELIAELKDTEPEMIKVLRKEIVTEIKPLYKIIKSNLESSKPFLSGFDHDGRTGLRRNPIRVTGKAVRTRRGKKTSLVSIRTVSGAVEIADMAGRKNEPNTRQGEALIAQLTERFGAASRFIYPSIENELPRVRASILKILEKYGDAKSRKILLNPKPKDK